MIKVQITNTYLKPIKSYTFNMTFEKHSSIPRNIFSQKVCYYTNSRYMLKDNIFLSFNNSKVVISDINIFC